ncbi:MAG: hypothetical protein ACR2PL_25510 [Dehalococcoidia bacterium]
MTIRPDGVDAMVLIEIEDPSELPDFANEQEELEFWDTHRPGEHFWDRAEPVAENERPPIDRSRISEPAPRQR